PGEYHVFSNVTWPYKTPNRYTISTYSSTPVEIQELDSDEVPSDYLHQILQSYLDKNVSPSQMTNSSTYQVSTGDNDTGFSMISFKNKSDHEQLKVSLDLSYNDKCVLYDDGHFTERNKFEKGATTEDSVKFVLPQGESHL